MYYNSVFHSMQSVTCTTTLFFIPCKVLHMVNVAISIVDVYF